MAGQHEANSTATLLTAASPAVTRRSVLAETLLADGRDLLLIEATEARCGRPGSRDQGRLRAPSGGRPATAGPGRDPRVRRRFVAGGVRHPGPGRRGACWGCHRQCPRPGGVDHPGLGASGLPAAGHRRGDGGRGSRTAGRARHPHRRTHRARRVPRRPGLVATSWLRRDRTGRHPGPPAPRGPGPGPGHHR